MRKIYFIALYFNLFHLYGQEKSIDSVEIKRIDKFVQEITSDTALRKVNFEKLNLEDGEKSPEGIAVYYKNNQIFRISFCYCSANNLSEQIKNGGIYVNYFIDNGELNFVNYQEVDNSRPGSCGYVQINHFFYFKKDKLIQSIVKGFNPCKPNWGKLNNTFDSAENQLQSFRKIYEIVKDKKPNR